MGYRCALLGSLRYFSCQDSAENEPQAPIEKGNHHSRHTDQDHSLGSVIDVIGQGGNKSVHRPAEYQYMAQNKYEHHLVGKDQQPIVPYPLLPVVQYGRYLTPRIRRRGKEIRQHHGQQGQDDSNSKGGR